MAMFKLILNFFDPFGIVRKHIIYPALEILFSTYYDYRNKTKNKYVTVRDLILRFGIISFAVAIILWTAVFMYIVFYYTYMPTIAHTRPVYMQFKACQEQSGPCSFPRAHVSLSKKQQLLMVGQAYKVLLNIDMPETPQNQELGMFMVCADMRDHESLLRGHSCRTAMLRYKSHLSRTISTWIYSPLLVFGFKEEFQRVPVELFSHYEEEQQHPITDVYVEIQSQKIQFYSVSLHITADFTGLRYIMFHWPILSAALGISTNLFFILTVFVLSWYHWSDTEWIKGIRDKYHKSDLNKSNMSSNFDTNNDSILDDEDLSYINEKFSDNKSDIEDLGGGGDYEKTFDEELQKIK